jgi:dephospho-CoA kinase
MTNPSEESASTIPTRVIGVLGGICSGKSQVAAILEEAGAARFDADANANAQLLEPEVRQKLIEWWGEKILDESGNLSNDALAEIVFSDASARERLEELIHPRVREAMHQAIRDANANQIPAIVLDIPLLYEAKLASICNVVLFIDTPEEVRIERAASDRGWGQDEVKRRESAQISLEEKRRRANVVIPNNATPADLHESVQSWYSDWIKAPAEAIEE